MSETPGSLVTWEQGIGDDKKYHVVHVDSSGLSYAVKLIDPADRDQLMAAATAAPAEAATLVAAHDKGGRLTRDQIERVTFAEQINQLRVHQKDGKVLKLAEGKEQKDVFEAIDQHLGGTASEEEADAWSVLQTPLLCTVVFGGIGALFIWMAAKADPNYEASGRRSGMKALLNTVLLWLGPVGTSLIVACFVVPPVAIGIYQLFKRPIRQVRSF